MLLIVRISGGLIVELTDVLHGVSAALVGVHVKTVEVNDASSILILDDWGTLEVQRADIYGEDPPYNPVCISVHSVET